MYFIGKKIFFLLFIGAAVCCKAFAYNAPHPKDPDLGEYSIEKNRDKNHVPVNMPPKGGKGREYVSTPPPESKITEANMSKEDMFEAFKEQSVDDEIKGSNIDSDDIKEVSRQLKEQYKGFNIKPLQRSQTKKIERM